MQPNAFFITAKLTGRSQPSLPNFLLFDPRQSVTSFDYDGPGGKSLYGPRHDNDCTYIHEINILPTADECLSTARRPWIPQKNVDSPHHIVHGPSRHLDTHFRLLRHDSVEKIRDVNYHAAQTSFLRHASTIPLDGSFVETPNGNRYFLYTNLKFQDIVAHERYGLVVRMNFACPANLRGAAMCQSTRLEKGMLVALLCLNLDGNKLSIHYFEIVQRESTFSLRDRHQNSDRAAVQLSMLPDASQEDVRELMCLVTGVNQRVTMALVEYPSMLYPGFANPLRCLKTMSDGDYAFAKYISPTDEVYVNSPVEMPVDPPAYTTRKEYEFNLSPLTGREDSVFKLDQLTGVDLDHVLRHLADHTTLDQGQSVALLSSLIRELAFTQGPPGTGKTFLSIALTRVLLASRSSKIPILLVCRTNHALDAFLAGLKDTGVGKLLRIGSSSREEWTKEISLREIAHKQKYTKSESVAKNHIDSEKQANWFNLEAWCKGLTQEALTSYPSWQQISSVVAREDIQTHVQLTTNVREPKAQAFIFDYWVQGGDLTTIQSLQAELARRLGMDTSKSSLEVPSKKESDIRVMLEDMSKYTTYHATKSGSADIWELSLLERQQLLRQWQAKIDKNAIALELCKVHLRHVKLSQAMRSAHDDRDIRIMKEHDIIGMTTTACAGRWEVLRRVGFQIMICEEAGEVLEAHALCSLFPTLQHAINIGDPLQLRPEVDQQSLALETQHGHTYRLNESLFERMMQPIDLMGKMIPTTRLNIQRRMHPEIADISRITYPYLQDHSETEQHLVPKGLKQRLWWFDHSIPEDTMLGVSKSITHEFEAQLVKALVSYLLRGSDYSPGDIAILTPYAGQVSRLRVLLSEVCSVWVSKKDREELSQNGIIDAEDEGFDEPARLSLSLKSLLRLATVDNFQGEEAKVVILCTVRSGFKLGFVKCPNRINVACSRARDGFYIVGNSKALRSNPVWSSIVEVFSKKNALQSYIGLQCDRHQEHTCDATTPADITGFPACQISCSQSLDCGHLCSEPCHDPLLHEVIPCVKPCTRALPCGHVCHKLCHKKCGPCKQPSTLGEASCGHLVSMSCGGEAEPCDHFKSYLDLSCGRHATALLCGGKAIDPLCDAVCGLELVCGHHCEGVCGLCQDGFHRLCSAICDKVLSCGHKCVVPCHTGSCPPCEKIFAAGCEHAASSRLCRDTPKRCLESVSLDDLTTLCAFTNLALDEIEPTFEQVVSTLTAGCRETLAAVSKASKALTQSHQLFLITLDPRALAASNNIEGILKRHDTFTAIQQEIFKLRGRLSCVEAGVEALNKISGRSLSIDSTILVKIEEIELQATIARSKDTIRTIPHLLKMKDGSMQMHRLAQELSTFVKKELRNRLKIHERASNWLLDDAVLECKSLLNSAEALMI